MYYFLPKRICVICIITSNEDESCDKQLRRQYSIIKTNYLSTILIVQLGFKNLHL